MNRRGAACRRAGIASIKLEPTNLLEAEESQLLPRQKQKEVDALLWHIFTESALKPQTPWISCFATSHNFINCIVLALIISAPVRSSLAVSPC